MKKLEIEKTKPTFIISVLKVDIINIVGLDNSIPIFLLAKFLRERIGVWKKKYISALIPAKNSSYNPM